MAKQKKVAFGIAEDGVNLKLAYLTREGHQISLQALEQVELEKSLYQHPGEVAPEGETKEETWNPDDALTGDLSLDEYSPDGMTTFKAQPYERLFQTYSLNSGVLAINVFDEQVIKLPVSTPNLSNKHKAKLAKENILPQEFKKGEWQNSVVTINDQAELWIHHGNNRLLEILGEAQKNQRVKYFFQLADVNETALANMFITNTPSESNEKNMVLYLGKEYRRALIFEGNKWTFSLPISVTQQPDIDIVYSKLSLAMDEAHISDPDNLFVCGDSCYLDSIEYLRSQLPNTNVEMWHFNNLYLEGETSQLYDSDMIARFALPIALAWKALTLDNPDTIRTNFLPSYVIEGQKVFKIAWHGYLLFALLFISALYLTFTVQRLRFDIQQQNALNKQLTQEYTIKKQEAEAMVAMQKAIEQQQANIETIKTLLKDKNPWTALITKLNNSFSSHPTSWITNLRKNGDGFKLSGVTTYRPNIVYFSGLFPDGQIINAKHRKIHSFTVWDFEINYNFPIVDWYGMMEADAEQLRKYQEEKRELELKKSLELEKSKAKSFSQGTTAAKIGDDQVIVKSPTIVIPYPAIKLIENNNDPVVKSYKDIITAFNNKSDWQMIDLGVKFINNYPDHALTSYVRWYLAYRSWQNKQYDKALLWLEPLQRKYDKVYPYTLLLTGEVYKDSGNRKRAETSWRAIIDDYPQHEAAKTAKDLLNG